MNDYDFRQLSDKEFEVFCCDLLSEELGSRFKRFKPGKDKGVDGRYFSSEGEVILQCKHWVKTPLSKLLKSLEESEAPKVRKLKPARYLLAVSHALSRADKDRLVETFSPSIQSPDDVFGIEDLNDILARHPLVERRHYKLWIASSNVLSTLLNASIVGRSDFLISDIIEESAKYVLTANHEAAASKLEDKRVIIITGSAGIGKTTLARNILMRYLAEGYELFSIGESISEAEGVFRNNEKQIFYFDDFLGSNYLDAISGNAGAHIAQFIKRIRSDRSKRFVLTSRTTILNQGKILIGALASQNTSKDEFEISLSSLSPLDKARILYNHIWHSGLADEFKEEIYKEKRYLKVVHHENYNPRIISYITDGQRIDSINPDGYWSHVLDMLDNPADVWGHPFDAQHDDYGRAIVLLVAMNGRAISQRDLSESYYRHLSLSAFSSGRGQRDFLINLRHLCGSMLNRVVMGKSETISLFNPSIGDYLTARYRKDPSVLKAMFMALRTDESLYNLANMASGGEISQGLLKEILISICRDAHLSRYAEYGPGYIARLHLLIKDLPEVGGGCEVSELVGAAEFIDRENLPGDLEDILDFYIYVRELGHNFPASIPRLVDEAVQKSPSAGELERLLEITRGHVASDDVQNMLRDAVVALLCDLAHDEFPASDVFEGLGWDEDMWDARFRLKEMINDRLSDFGMSDDSDIIESVVDSYDIEDQARSYFMSHDNEGYSSRGSRGVIDMVSDIDDLFDRS